MSGHLDYSAAADLYSRVATFKTRNKRYLRFLSAAEAIRFAIEEMPGETLRSVAIEFGEDRYEGDAIRTLYDAPEYPLERSTS